MCSNIQAGTSTRRQGSTTWIPATFAFNAILAHIPQILQGKRVAYEVKSNTRESARYPTIYTPDRNQKGNVPELDEGHHRDL
jgi:hypothetical protein